MNAYLFKDSPRNEGEQEVEDYEDLHGNQNEERISPWQFIVSLEKKFRLFIEKKIY